MKNFMILGVNILVLSRKFFINYLEIWCLIFFKLKKSVKKLIRLLNILILII